MFLYQQAKSKAALLLAISYLLTEAAYKNNFLNYRCLYFTYTLLYVIYIIYDYCYISRIIR